MNPGLIWLDEQDAARVIDARLRAGEITSGEAANLEKFARDGYFVTRIALTAEEESSIDADVERLWREKPRNIAVAYDTAAKRFADADESRERKPRYRIPDFHAASDVAMRLVLDPLLHRYASLILGDTAVATQSLYFEFGSQQDLHRDSTIVPTPEFGRLVAAWIALEDIAAESGPLAFVPGSQKFPFYELRAGEYTFNPAVHTAADADAAVRFYRDQLERSGLPVKQFLAKRGEVLMWHSALMHGGAPPANPQHTRKSLAVHYSTLKTQSVRYGTVLKDGKGESVYSTSKILERNGALAFANPLDGEYLYDR